MAGGERRGFWAWIEPYYRILIGAYLAALALATGVLLVLFWPSRAVGPDGSALPLGSSVPENATIALGPMLANQQMPYPTVLLVLVLLGGALGGTIRTLLSFSRYTSNGQFSSRWVYWYTLLPFQGALLALAVYMTFHAGFAFVDPLFVEMDLPPHAPVSGAMLTGLFTRNAVTWLARRADAFFGSSDRDVDDRDASLRVPRAEFDVHDVQIDTGTTPPTVTIRGRGLDGASDVRIDDRPLAVERRAEDVLVARFAGRPEEARKVTVVRQDGARKVFERGAAGLFAGEGASAARVRVR